MFALVAFLILIVLIVIYDLVQRKHAILRNFPLIGHFRYLLEMIGPELRQYIVVNNNEERPFDRDQRSWIYSTAKKQNDYFAFGSDNEFERSSNYLIIKHSAFPLLEALPDSPNYDPSYQIPCAKVLGGWRNRAKKFRPASIVNVSGMSYGSLSEPAVVALNKGCHLANSLQNTGEGGLAPAHRNGGELIWQIGTGYFGCRDAEGGFSFERFLETCSYEKIRAIEIKLSQGAKPGLGGVLPGKKVSPEIAVIRGVVPHIDCISPSGHSAFTDVDTLIEFVEKLADATGLPVGIKSAVGHMQFWRVLAKRMKETGRGPDFITIDGGEGGTGAAPLVFADHVSLPFKIGMAGVYREFVEQNLHEKIVFIGSGKLGFPEAAIFALALGADMVNIGREAMISIGCIQAMRCHTNRCPTGVATQSKWLQRGLDPQLKSVRLANYVTVLRKEILRLSRACGVCHPALITISHLEIINDRFQGVEVSALFNFHESWGQPSDEDKVAIEKLMDHPAQRVPRHPEAPKVTDTPTVSNKTSDAGSVKSGTKREKI